MISSLKDTMTEDRLNFELPGGGNADMQSSGSDAVASSGVGTTEPMCVGKDTGNKQTQEEKIALVNTLMKDMVVKSI